MDRFRGAEHLRIFLRGNSPFTDGSSISAQAFGVPSFGSVRVYADVQNIICDGDVILRSDGVLCYSVQTV